MLRLSTSLYVSKTTRLQEREKERYFLFIIRSLSQYYCPKLKDYSVNYGLVYGLIIIFWRYFSIDILLLSRDMLRLSTPLYVSTTIRLQIESVSSVSDIDICSVEKKAGSTNGLFVYAYKCQFYLRISPTRRLFLSLPCNFRIHQNNIEKIIYQKSKSKIYALL